MTINITILGSTGSIGRSTLQVIALHPERFQVFALTAHHNVEIMLEQCKQFQPRYVVMQDNRAAELVEQSLKKYTNVTQVLSGESALVAVAEHASTDYVMACIVGAAGLLPTLAAAQAGKRILLANKEALVMSGSLFMQAVRANKAILLPVDSEHNAIFQCLPTDFQVGTACPALERIILTASGGAFRDWPLEQLTTVTPEKACQHPNWLMGPKVTVDSATMMNKGLEVIEAHWLFNLEVKQLDVVLHRQSIIHSLVEYKDGSLLAQLGQPDMRIPITHALAWPERIQSGAARLNLLEVGRLDFQPLCVTRYPCLRLSYEALQAGGTASTVLNAANEVAVQAFLERQIDYLAIPKLIEKVLSKVTIQAVEKLADIFAADAISRYEATEILKQLRSNKSIIEAERIATS